jgi:formate hydrogenlyase subunit 3/multisubunit Na+/H+ antiporter MnhD subunit
VIEAGLVALLRSLGPLAAAAASWGALVLLFGTVNMVAGNLLALRQTQVKRLLAYSSISHMGYMLVGFGVAVGYGVTDGAQGGFFHLITHALMKGLAFLAAGVLLYSLHVAHGRHAPLVVEDLDGAAHRYMSKWQIFVAGFETGNPMVQSIVIFAGLNSVLSLAYYAPLVNRMYRGRSSAAVEAGRRAPVLMQAPVAALAGDHRAGRVRAGRDLRPHGRRRGGIPLRWRLAWTCCSLLRSPSSSTSPSCSPCSASGGCSPRAQARAR